MKRFSFIVVLVAAFATAQAAQSVTSLLQGSQTTTPSTVKSDPLGRDNPSGTVFGFLQTAQSGNSRGAADYLQMSPVRRQSQGPDLANKLKQLMDRAFVGSMRRISTRAEGNPEDGDADTQKIGTFENGEFDVPVTLVRVTDPNFGKIWLFSSETLSKVPELYDNVQSHRIDSKLPQSLLKVFLGMALWQWLALLIEIPVAAIIGWALVLLLEIPRHLWLKYRHKPNLHSYKHVSAPLLLVFATFAHRAMASYVGLALLPRVYYFRTTGIVLITGFGWLAVRFTNVTMRRLRGHALSLGKQGTSSLMLLGERLLRVLIISITLLAILSVIGFNLTTVLAGLGIGGIAIAFAAQKTLENLFGGVSVLADEVFRVGDTCRFGDRTGTIEDIGLRSTRIRTTERSELSIPNGALATINVENLSRRDKLLFNPTISVRYETTPDQLRYLLAQARRMLYEHPKVEASSARIRFVSFAQSALNLEIFSYILTIDDGEYNAVREDLLLRLLEIVRNSGTDFAFPSQTLYMTRDRGLDQEKLAAAEQQVQDWRDQRQLPFPDYAPADKSAFRGAIAYPHPESAVGKPSS